MEVFSYPRYIYQDAHIISYLGGLGHWWSANKSSVLIISDQWEASTIIAPPLGVKPRCCLLSWEGNRRKPGGLVKYLNTARYMKWDILSVFWPGERRNWWKLNYPQLSIWYSIKCVIKFLFLSVQLCNYPGICNYKSLRLVISPCSFHWTFIIDIW